MYTFHRPTLFQVYKWSRHKCHKFLLSISKPSLDSQRIWRIGQTVGFTYESEEEIGIVMLVHQECTNKKPLRLQISRLCSIIVYEYKYSASPIVLLVNFYFIFLLNPRPTDARFPLQIMQLENLMCILLHV